MNERELFDAWKRQDVKEEKIFEQNKGQYERLAQKKSNDVFKKVERNMIVETVAGLLVLVVFLVLCSLRSVDDFYVFDRLVFVVMCLISGFGVWLYGKCLLNLRRVNESDLQTSLSKKIIILSRYVRVLNILSRYFGPVCFVLGFLIGFTRGGKDFDTIVNVLEMKVVFLILISMIVFCIILDWLMRKYIYALYGKHLDTIKEVYQELTQDEGCL